MFKCDIETNFSVVYEEMVQVQVLAPLHDSGYISGYSETFKTSSSGGYKRRYVNKCHCLKKTTQLIPFWRWFFLINLHCASKKKTPHQQARLYVN
jgi:hypothetical protein